MGDEPQLRDPRLNFTVEGVAGEDDLTPAPKSLQGCTKFPVCRGMLSFVLALLLLLLLLFYTFCDISTYTSRQPKTHVGGVSCVGVLVLQLAYPGGALT